MSELITGLQVPYSTGRNTPSVRIPKGACDCHHHIYDPVHFPYLPTDIRNQPPAGTDCYLMLKKRLGIYRNVIVQPSAYGTDNRCTMVALQQLGIESTRAIVVIDDSISDLELLDMHACGVRGVRFNIATGGSADFDMIRRIAERIAPLGWCICFWMNPSYIFEQEQLLRDLPCNIVFDHRGHIPAGSGVDSPAVEKICELIKEDHFWVKLSGLYLDNADPDYADTIAIGRRYVETNADHCIWGSDWPHPSCYSSLKPMPNDADLLDALMQQAGDEKTFKKILVDNPEKLYGFRVIV